MFKKFGITFLNQCKKIIERIKKKVGKAKIILKILEIFKKIDAICIKNCYFTKRSALLLFSLMNKIQNIHLA